MACYCKYYMTVQKGQGLFPNEPYMFLFQSDETPYTFTCVYSIDVYNFLIRQKLRPW